MLRKNCITVGGTGGYFPDEASNGNGKPWTNDANTAITDFFHAKVGKKLINLRLMVLTLPLLFFFHAKVGI